MRTRALRVTCFALIILVWAGSVAMAGLSLWKRHSCLINAATECTQEMESK